MSPRLNDSEIGDELPTACAESCGRISRNSKISLTRRTQSRLRGETGLRDKRLEQLYRITRGIFEKKLPAADPGNDIVSKMRPSFT